MRKLRAFLWAWDHKLRQHILYLCLEREMCVTDLHIETRVDQATISQHLKILRDAGLIDRRRDGKYMYYSTLEMGLEEMSNLIENFEPIITLTVGSYDGSTKN